MCLISLPVLLRYSCFRVFAHRRFIRSPLSLLPFPSHFPLLFLPSHLISSPVLFSVLLIQLGGLGKHFEVKSNTLQENGNSRKTDYNFMPFYNNNCGEMAKIPAQLSLFSPQLLTWWLVTQRFIIIHHKVAIGKENNNKWHNRPNIKLKCISLTKLN